MHANEPPFCFLSTFTCPPRLLGAAEHGGKAALAAGYWRPGAKETSRPQSFSDRNGLFVAENRKKRACL